MNDIDKLRVLLQHWIDHNKGHAEEFEKWRLVAAEGGDDSVAMHISQAIAAMKQANDALENALQEAGGPVEGGHHHHHHH